MSARTGDGVAALREDLPAILPRGPRYFPEGMATDQTDEELAAELIREGALLRLRQEYRTPWPSTSRRSSPPGAGSSCGRAARGDRVAEGHRRGRGGGMIRDIGAAAARPSAGSGGPRSHLNLTVRVRKRWRDDEAMLTRRGL